MDNRASACQELYQMALEDLERQFEDELLFEEPDFEEWSERREKAKEKLWSDILAFDQEQDKDR